MGFVTPALLGGILLVGIPIVLHLVMRRESQKLIFPALRFLQRRQTLNQHRLRLRHLLLLALRCAIIALLAFALARPTLRGSGAAGKENDPIAAALVFDNSLRMTYQQDNQIRLDKARDLGSWLLEQLPADCPLAVIDRSTPFRSRSLDRSAAELRLERLAPSSVTRPMEDALKDALDWLRQQTDHRGEVYIFTDMSTAVWSDDLLTDFAKRLAELPGASVYVIDVGVERPHNYALGNLRLSGEEITPGSLLQLDTDLSAIGNNDKPANLGIELYLDDSSAGPQKRGQQDVTISHEAEPATIKFSLSGMQPGTHQGFVRIVGSDPLPCDDTRFFTVEVRAPRNVLLLGERPEDTVFLREALAPSAAAGLVRPKFACTVKTFADFDKISLADVDAVCLVDPTPLPTSAWQALTDYVHSGGGLSISLGRHAKRDEFNEPAPQQLLPAKLRWQSRDTTYLRPQATEHPVLAELGELAATAPWSEFPIFRYWELEPLPADAYVIAPYANGQPALIERHIGTGRAITLTTSVSDPAHSDPWNLLPTAPDPWPFLALANGLVEYLAGSGDSHFNYLAGQTALLRLAPDQRVSSYVLDVPPTGGEPTRSAAVRQSLPPGQSDISITSTDTLGNYRVRAGGEQGRLDRGFSVNCSTEISQLTRADFATIEAALGKDRVRLARTTDEIEVRVGIGRVGRELFPALIIAVALVLAAEQILANHFYRVTA